MLKQLLLALVVAFASTCGQAQDLAAGMRFVTADEARQLRELLAEPVPAGAAQDTLRRHFDRKFLAAQTLSDNDAQEYVLKAATALLPDANLRNFLGDVYFRMGRYPEAIAQLKEALRIDPGYIGAMVNLSHAFRSSGAPRDARQWIARARTAAEALKPTRPLGKAFQQRMLGRVSNQEANLEFDVGRVEAGLARAAEALAFAKTAYQLSNAAPPLDQQMRLLAVVNYSADLTNKLQAVGKFYEAERSLAELMRFAQTQRSLPASTRPGIYATASKLSQATKDFKQAESYALKAELAWADLGVAADDIRRINASKEVLNVLVARDRLEEATARLQSLDLLAKDNDRLRRLVQFPGLRGELLLKSRNYTQALPYLRQSYSTNGGARSHKFSAARAAGFLGVALWRMNTEPSRREALPLLISAVRDYMAPENADYMVDSYDRNRQRDLIFSTFLEAVSLDPAADANLSLVAADWVRSSAVQEAVSDAATRAAAATPAMADLVRQDTDRRNEIRALRSYVSEEEPDTRFPAEVEVQMRARILELEAQRAQLHMKIKSSFPEYEQLVRPSALGIADITSLLAPGQALLVLLPTQDAVYEWVVSANGASRPVRNPIPLDRLSALVQRLRDSLEFGASNGRPRSFDVAASAELYQALLKPLEGAIADKTDLVVATAGPLAQIPFSVLVASVSSSTAGEPDWLIKRASITHVPSISSWMAVKRFAQTTRAAEPMMGWGDPLFDRTATRPASADGKRAVSIVRTVAALDFDKPVAQSGLDYTKIPPLPETRDELVSIARVLKANPSSDLKFGEYATRDSVMAASQSGALSHKRVVAFATHGLMARDLPELTQPALALANTYTADPLASLLTLEDVLSLKLNADWVVLSACNTAAADGKAEEALSGLARGFFYAGTRSLLVTHWAVESESAKQLTTGAFAHYAEHPRASKAESLRQSMLALMRQAEFAHPAYWAPYALVGDGGR